MVRKALRDFDGRWIALALVTIKVLMWLSVWMETGGQREAWDHIGVNPMEITFADLRAVTAGYECVLRGFDIMIENPCDPWGRLANYPRLWQAPAYWGLNGSHTETIGFSLIALFLLLIPWLFRKKLTWYAGVFVGVALTSRPLLLAFERGNIDLFPLILMTAALLVLCLCSQEKGQKLQERYGLGRSLLGSGLILFSGVLKLFPIAALAPWLLRRGFKGAAVVGFTGFLIYFVMTIDDIRVISKIVPQYTEISFGSSVVSDLFVAQLGLSQDWLASHLQTLRMATRVIFMLFVMAAFYVFGTSLDRLRRESLARSTGLAFDMGAAIYVGTFLIGHNYDYRLSFLILTVPLLAELLSEQKPRSARLEWFLSFSLVVLLITSCRASGWRDETANWAAAVIFGAYLARAAIDSVAPLRKILLRNA